MQHHDDLSVQQIIFGVQRFDKLLEQFLGRFARNNFRSPNPKANILESLYPGKYTRVLIKHLKTDHHDKTRCHLQPNMYTTALWSITAKNTKCSTGPLARLFARSVAPLTRSLAPDCSLRLHPPLRSFVRSLAHFAHSLARGKVNY